MFLHNNKDEFGKLIEEISNKTNIDNAILEKDYYVTLFLQALVLKESGVIFKGGTCLSKCYKVIERFSEDIDITMPPATSQSIRKKLKYYIVDTASELGLRHLNSGRVDSGKSYGKHRISYSSLFYNATLNPELVVETVFRPMSIPTQVLPANSFIYDCLLENGRTDIVDKYGMQPFDVTAQSLQLTFIEKIFGLCNYYLENRIEAHSRHLYDLHKILPHIKFNDEFGCLLGELCEYEKIRHINTTNFMTDKKNLEYVLLEIIDSDIYKLDYENITEKLLFESVPYKDTIKSLQNALCHIKTVLTHM